MRDATSRSPIVPFLLKDEMLTQSNCVDSLAGALTELGFEVEKETSPKSVRLVIVEELDRVDFSKGIISPHHELSLLEQCLRCIQIDFSSLDLLTEGESKEVRLLTHNVVIERFKPTVYSYTQNRYGVAEGTDAIRSRFSAEVFRRMSRLESKLPFFPKSAFLGLVESDDGPLVVQRRIEDSNLEARVKRYHIGSPLHRYRYTDCYATTQQCGPLRRWSKFDQPVVCFDWRHPIKDEDGCRLADEPISDDYAAVWIEDISHAKEMARATFLWLESQMANVDLVLVDMCMFIDRTGHFIFGEISPDCMRVRAQSNDLDHATAFDKDIWRSGASGNIVAQRYQMIHDLMFGKRGTTSVSSGSVPLCDSRPAPGAE